MTDEELARAFHEAYERRAAGFGYKTREASAVPWEQVPENNRKLMIAVAGEVRAALEANPPLAEVEGWVSTLGIDHPITSQGLTIWPNDEPNGWLTPVDVTIRGRKPVEM